MQSHQTSVGYVGEVAVPKVAVLHTSFIFATVEPVITDLITELVPGVELMHFVDSDDRHGGARSGHLGVQ